MKRTLKLWTLTLLSVLFFQNLKASHVLGGDIKYIYVAPDKYKVVFKLYRECSGVPLGLNQVRFGVSTADGNVDATITANRTSIKDISLVCKNDTLPCDPNNTTTNSSTNSTTSSSTNPTTNSTTSTTNSNNNTGSSTSGGNGTSNGNGNSGSSSSSQTNGGSSSQTNGGSSSQTNGQGGSNTQNNTTQDKGNEVIGSTTMNVDARQDRGTESSSSGGGKKSGNGNSRTNPLIISSDSISIPSS
jgi:hypothetical protein